MSTTVCQNLVSCFELKLSPPENQTTWNFPQTTTTTKESSSSFYTQKSSFSKLSAKSLELCTENLGSETGTDQTSSTSIFSTWSTEKNSSPPISVADREISPQKYNKSSAKEVVINSCKKNKKIFPPPLTSMSGSNSLRVRRHIEGGRLIIEAVEAPPVRNSCLQAERSDGRLRLCFLKEAESPVESPAESPVETTAIEQMEYENEENVDMENIGFETFQRLGVGRCKESGHESSKGLCSTWKPALWVAI